jgi:quinol monooxygenase YgiN
MAELQAIARYTITAGQVDEVLPLVQQMAEASRAEPGNLAFDAYRRLDDDREVVLLERYESREAFEAHRDTPHFRTLVLERIVPRLDSRTVEVFDVP